MAEENILINGNFVDEDYELCIPIQNIDNIQYSELNQSFLPLYAFNLIERYDNYKTRSIDNQIVEKISELSINSGVLCKYTAFIGVSENVVAKDHFKAMKAPLRLWGGGLAMCCKKPKKSCGMLLEMAAPKKVSAKCCRNDHYEIDKLESAFPINDEIDDISDFLCRDLSTRTSKNDKATHTFNVLEFSRLQTIYGSWRDLNQVQKIGHTNIQNIEGLIIDGGSELQEEVIATLIALAILRQLESSQKSQTIMLQYKALSWLEKTLSSHSKEEIEQFINRISKDVHI